MGNNLGFHSLEGIHLPSEDNDRSTNRVHEIKLVVGTARRNQLTITELIFESMAWGLVCTAWGATLKRVVCDNLSLSVLSSFYHPTADHYSLNTYLSETATSDGSDLLVATCRNLSSLLEVGKVLKKHSFKVILLAIPSTISRRQASDALFYNELKLLYAFRRSTLVHTKIGGATDSVWSFITLRASDLDWIPPPSFSSNLPPTSIFNMIDDKIGGGYQKIPKKTLSSLRDSSELGWDLSLSPSRVDYWVRCESVFSPASKIIRRLALHELAGLWDFQLPDEHDLDSGSRKTLLISLLQGPPGKMLRKLSYEPLRFLWKSLGLSRQSSQDDHTTGIDYSSVEVSHQAIQSSHLKAVKADDAPIDFEIWRWPNESQQEQNARDLLRLSCHSFWRRNLTREAISWLVNSPNSIASERKINVAAIIDCLTRTANSTFWDWSDGSTLLFWRWEHWWKSARDGELLFHHSAPPTWKGQNLPAPSEHYEVLLRKKEEKLLYRRYLEPGFVDCIVPRFGVPKGEDDIRLVWDASRNGVNETLWAPSFIMPTFRTLQDQIIKWLPCSVTDYLNGNLPSNPTSSDWRIPHQADMDVGEMFLNYKLHHSERHTFGVRLITGFGDDQVQVLMRFCRLLFGGRPCPFLAVQGHARAIELAVGDHKDPANPLHWADAIGNFPFDQNYDPSLPRIIRVRHDGEMAAATPAFVDDGRIAGVSEQICDAATHRFCTRINYLGEQNASRKRRPKSRKPGAWTGKMLWTTDPHPVKGVLPEKWKLQRDDLLALKKLSDEGVDPERSLFLTVTCRGMSQTEVYSDLRPYYKSFYNALEAWRPNRSDDGWKLQDFDAEAGELFDNVDDKLSAPPPTVRITREAKRDLEALLLFYSSEEPEFLLVRPREKCDVVYMGGDASAAAYGAGEQHPDGRVTVWLGNWTMHESRKGSNWREAANLARALLRRIESGDLDGKEVWMATDNLVWALIANKGMSKSKGLSDIVRDIKLACRKHEVFWHPFHVSGKRMIKMGFDGLSRGDFDSGIMLGEDIRDLVPLGHSPLDFKGNAIEAWAKTWMGSDYTQPLTIEQWFSKGHQSGVHFWAPPPAGALVALEELAQSKLKRPYDVTHVFVCQRLLYFEEWRRRFNKEMDLWLLIEPVSYFWPNSCCEPLVFGISFPLRHSRPWKLRRVPEVVALGRNLQEVFKTRSELGECDILRKLWEHPWGFFGL